jgi:hypothetical protein
MYREPSHRLVGYVMLLRSSRVIAAFAKHVAMTRTAMMAIAICVWPSAACAAEFTSKPYEGATVTADTLSWAFRSTAPVGDEYSGVAYELSSEDIWHGCLDSPHEVLLSDPASGKYTIAIADDYTAAFLVSEGLALEASRLCSLPPIGGFTTDTVTLTRKEGLSLPVNTPAEYKDEGPAWTAGSAGEASARVIAEYDAERKAKEEREHPPASADAPAPVAPAPCVVPALIHHSLAGARRLLVAAHCKLGRTRTPHARHGTLVVISQSPRRGQVLPAAASVTVRLGHVKRD